MLCSIVQLGPTLCNSGDCSPSGSSIHGILQARILEWVVMPPPGDLPDPGMEPTSLTSHALSTGFFTTFGIWEALLSKFRACLTGFVSMCSPLSALCWQGIWRLHFTREIHLTLRNSLHWQSIPWVSFLLTSVICTCCFLNRESHHQSFPLSPLPPGMAGNIHLSPPEFYYPLTVTNISNSVFICE